MARRTLRNLFALAVPVICGCAAVAHAGRQFDDLPPPPQAKATPVPQPRVVTPAAPCPNCDAASVAPWYGVRRYSGYYPYEPSDLYSRQVEHGAYSSSPGPYGFQLGMGLVAGAADQAAYPPGYGYRYPAWNSGYYNNGGFYPQTYGGSPYGGPPMNGGYPPAWGGGGYYPPPVYMPGPASLAPPVNPYTTGPSFW